MPTSDRKPASKDSSPPAAARPEARSNAVWQWAADTARLAMVTTSQLIRKIDISGLSIEGEDTAKNQQPSKPGTDSARATTPASGARNASGGFDPYNKKTVTRASAPRKPAAPVARKPVSWWRRLFQRR
ncbi:MAG TPA: hypothetical protein VGF89_07660 [Steroidobacteraceae bacterium]|jgi:hypothetical protein